MGSTALALDFLALDESTQKKKKKGMVDTTDNAELSIEKNTGLASIIRVCPHYSYVDEEGIKNEGFDFPDGDIYLKIRLHKEGVERVNFLHCTNVWILVGKFDDSNELKVKSDDVLEVDGKIVSQLVSKVFTSDFIAKTGISSIADMEQASIAQGLDCSIGTIETSIDVPQSMIDKYDVYMDVEI